MQRQSWKQWPCAILAACMVMGTPLAGAQNLGNVDKPRLLAANNEPGNWFTGGRDFGKTHYSPLKQMHDGNIDQLGFAWEYKTQTKRGLQATPIVVDGVMFTSGVAGRVYALDAATGQELWKFEPDVDMQVNRVACCDMVNRGVSVWQGHVYTAALDGKVYKLNAQTGAVVWQGDAVADHGRGHASTGAPIVAGDVVVIGNSGSEYDARGYVTALDLATGQVRWRFYVVPGDPFKPYEHPELEAAAKTWDPSSKYWEAGGGGTPWDGMTYDPELNLLYVGTGNGAPHSYAKRSNKNGDNLYLVSILAIRPDTGRLAWHVQQYPGDFWDYTATSPIVLTDLPWKGRTRKVLMQAPKNGIFYIIDRATGEVLSADPYVPVNWVKSIELGTGRATVDEAATDPTQSPKLVFPSGQGGHNWNPMSFNPDTGLVYIPAIEVGEYGYDPAIPHHYRPKTRGATRITAFSGGLNEAAIANFPPQFHDLLRSGKLKEGQPDTTERAYLRAWDPVRSRTVWQVESPGGSWDRAGVLSTAGNLVFQGTGTGAFNVFDARTGKKLKEIFVGSTIVAAPMTYTVNGEQYVSVMAGWGGAAWWLYRPNSAAAQRGNEGRILTFKLGGGETPVPPLREPIPDIQQPPARTASAEMVTAGKKLFDNTCRWCHGNVSPIGSADLRRSASIGNAEHFRTVVLEGGLLPMGMPRFDDILNANDVEMLRAYLIDNAWQAYEAQERKKGATAASATPAVATPQH